MTQGNIHDIIKRLFSSPWQVIHTHLMDPPRIRRAVRIPAYDETFISISLMLEMLSDLELYILLRIIPPTWSLSVSIASPIGRHHVHQDLMLPFLSEHGHYDSFDQTEVFWEVLLEVLGEVG